MVFNLRTFSLAESIEEDPTAPKSFSLEELQVATDNFSCDNVLADAGNKFYRGHLADGSLVVVKRARFITRRSKESFKAEVQVGSSVSTHSNVLHLRGFCRTKKELIVVYPMMINNDLAYHLRERHDRSTRPLDWTTRKRIALGAARGLAYLHDIKIIHRNICAYSILLDSQFEAVIGGFSYAIIMHDGNARQGTTQGDKLKYPARVSSSSQGKDSADSDSCCQICPLYEDVHVDSPGICGTCTSVAPEYLFTVKCTLKNDVYAYGKILLELISGRPSIELDKSACNENLSLEEWIGGFMNMNELGRVIDPNLQGNYVEEEAKQLVRLALLCADGNLSVQPKMSEVVTIIESQMIGQDSSNRNNWSGSEYDSTPYYSFPPSPSLSLETC